MSDPKAKNSKAKVQEVEVKEEDQIEQVMKMVGKDGKKPVQLSFGDYYVQELQLMDVMVLAAKCSDLLYLTVQFAGGADADLTRYLSMLSHVDGVREKLGLLFALCCGAESDAEHFERISDEDMMILFPLLRELDWTRIHKNFLGLGLQRFTQPPTSTDG